MAKAANAAAAAAIGLDDPGLNDLTTSERLEPVSMPADAAASDPLQGMRDAGQPASQPCAPANHQVLTPESMAAEPEAHATFMSMLNDHTGSASAAPEAASASGAGAVDSTDQPMQVASQPAAASQAPEQMTLAEQPPEQMTQTHTVALQDMRPSEQLTQAYPAASRAMQPPEQMTQAHVAASMEVDDGSMHNRAFHDASVAQSAEQGNAALQAPNAAQALSLGGKPFVAGSAIFTKVSPMKGKVGFFTSMLQTSFSLARETAQG